MQRFIYSNRSIGERTFNNLYIHYHCMDLINPMSYLCFLYLGYDLIM